MFHKITTPILIFLITAILFIPSKIIAKELDHIVAIVESDVILSSELESKLNSIKKSLLAQNTQLPPDSIIRKQVLERMIMNKIQRLLAKRGGITADNETLQKSISRLSKANGMTTNEFRQALDNQGIEYTTFVKDLRNEIILNRLRGSQVDRKIRISDNEIERLLEAQGKFGGTEQTEFRIGHILISTPEAASPNQVQQARLRAEKIIQNLEDDGDFKKTAVAISDGAQALQGGDLGWRKLGQIPTIFSEQVAKMARGSIAGPIRSPSGFHIIKLLNIKGIETHIISQTRVRHILIKTNDLISDEYAKSRLLGIKERLENDEDFATLARAHSDDTSSAIKGGELGWVSSGALVKPFEETMNKLSPNELSNPIQTQFGWHLIQVQERKNRDNTIEYKRNKARIQIRRGKIEEEKTLWLRRLRDEAYVDIRLKD